MDAAGRLLRAVGLAAAFGLPVAVLAFAVRVGSHGVVEVDQAAIRWATDLTRARPALREGLLVAQEVLQARWLNIGFGLVCLAAWRRAGLGSRALWALTTLLVAWGTANLVRVGVERARPVVRDAVAQAPGYSFPSGHTANVTAGVAVTVVLLWPVLGRRGRALTVAAGLTLVAATGADRLLLGVHYPSDVLGGVLLGSALVAGSALGYLRPLERPGPRTTPGEA